MDEVVAADGGGIAVTHGHNDLQVWAGQFDSCGEGQSAPVQGVHSVEVNIPRHSRRTADAGHHHQR